MARFERQATLTGIQSPTREFASATEQLRESFRKAGEFGRLAWERSRVEQAQKAAAEVQHVPGAPLGNLSPMTSYGRAFNVANEAGYIAATKNQYMDALDRMSREHSNDPVAFENAAKAYRNSLIENVPAEVRIQISSDFDQTTRSNAVAIRDRAAKLSIENSTIEIDRAGQGILSEAAKASRMGDEDYLAHQTNLFYDTVITPLEALGDAKGADDALNNYLAQVDEARHMGQYDRAVQQGRGSAFISEFMTNPPKELGMDQVDEYSKKMAIIEKRRESMAAARQGQMTVEQQITVSNTLAAIDSGVIGGEEALKQLDGFLRNGWITMDKRTSAIKKMMESEQKAIDKEAAFQNIAAGIQEGMPVVAEKKDINEYYEKRFVPGLAGQDPDSVFNATTQFIRGTKTVPDTMKRELNAMVLSENPEHIRNAARIADAIDDIPGVMEQAFNPEQRAFISQVIPLLDNMSPAEAVRVAKEVTDPRDKARVDARKEALKEKTDYAANVTSDLDPWFGPDIKNVNVDQLNSEYKQLYDAYYLNGMTESAAREQAVKTLKRNWGDFNGYVMKHPPQNFYAVPSEKDETGTAYIMDQLVNDIATQTIGKPLTTESAWAEFANEYIPFWKSDEKVSPSVVKENIYLISDERTAKEAEMGKPSYRVIFMTEEGIKPLAGFRFVPDASKEVNRIKEKNKKLLELESVSITSIEAAEEYLSKNAPEWYDMSGRSKQQRIKDAKDFLKGTYRADIDVGTPIAE
jgi:hypothetical protein